MVIWSALFSGILLCLTQPRFNLWFVAYVAIIPLLYVLKKQPAIAPKKAGMAGYILGFIYMLYCHHWLWTLKAFVPGGWIILIGLLLVSYQALFYGATFYLFVRLQSKSWLFPVLWTLFEWLRSIGPIGNTTGALGISQVYALPIAQLAAIGGIWLITFTLAALNITLSIPSRNRLIASGLIFMLVYTFGEYRLHMSPPQSKMHTVAIIQGNHAQMMKLSDQYFYEIQNTYTRLTTRVAIHVHPEVILWPETVTPYFNLDNRAWMSTLQTLTHDQNITLILGTPVETPLGHYNAIVAINPSEISPQHYYKMRLMPFGEYWPFRNWLSSWGLSELLQTNDYESGKQHSTVPTLIGPMGGILCLESLYPIFTQGSIQNGAGWIGILANNAWFLDSIAADIHFNMAKMRAIESNHYVVQAANTGISAIISNTGKIITQSKLNTTCILIGRIQTNFPKSPFHRIGNWVIIGCLFTLGARLLTLYRRK